MDFRLYLPQQWAGDDARRQAAGVPEQVEFATKPTLALQMIEEALDGGVKAGWAAGDEVYGNDPRLRAGLRDRALGYVLAIRRDTRLARPDHPGRTVTAAQVASWLPGHVWGEYMAGYGTKGPRYYAWAWVKIVETEAGGGTRGHHWLLFRRNTRTGELAYYRCWSPDPVSLPTLTHVAGLRWPVESCFQDSKGLTGLDEHQVRTWTSWHRYTTLVLAAYAFLAVLAAAQPKPPPSMSPDPHTPIPLTAHEIRRLLHHTLTQAHTSMHHALRWLAWRLLHQARARYHHYKRRLALDNNQ